MSTYLTVDLNLLRLIFMIPRPCTTHVHLAESTMSTRHRSAEECPGTSIVILVGLPYDYQLIMNGKINPKLIILYAGFFARIPIVTLYIYL
jgi:hypothetical protein